MFPNVLVWHPEAARALLEYRIRTLAGALDNARRLGYQVRGAWATSLQGATGLRVARPHPGRHPSPQAPSLDVAGVSWVLTRAQQPVPCSWEQSGPTGPFTALCWAAHDRNRAEATWPTLGSRVALGASRPPQRLWAESMGTRAGPLPQIGLRPAPPCNAQGAKFAWESAGSGLEVCPEDIYGAQEIHINGAVLLAFQLYYHSTQVSRHRASGRAPRPAGTSWLGPALRFRARGNAVGGGN